MKNTMTMYPLGPFSIRCWAHALKTSERPQEVAEVEEGVRVCNGVVAVGSEGIGLLRVGGGFDHELVGTLHGAEIIISIRKNIYIALKFRRSIFTEFFIFS
jgi:hypothetical protein